MNGRARLLNIYASKDNSLRQSLEEHLTALVKEGLIDYWHIGLLPAGAVIDQHLTTEVARADVVLLLLSASFMASTLCQDLLAQVQQQSLVRPVTVVPILARTVDWRGLGMEGRQILPRNGIAVTLWDNEDAAWLEVATELRGLLTGVPLLALEKTIDFAGERSRHQSFLGREDVLARLDQWLLGGRRWGYVLVTGGPGRGKSAILSEWLRRREQAGEPVPHHFLRRSQHDWDQPAVVTRNLAAQVERLFPKQRNDKEAPPEQRLDGLLQRVSKEVLEQAKRRLILVIDGLDEAAAIAGDNPLPLFLPSTLPPGVLVLCASRPTYPNLGWLKARDGGVPTVDLDDEKWSGSNEGACRCFWQAQKFTPPLPASLIEQAMDRGRGNLLYTVKLRDQLELLSVEERQVIALPEGLEGWFDESWQKFVADEACWPLLERGLGLLCAAREALPISVLDLLLGGVLLREALLRRVRSVLLEERLAWRQTEDGKEEPAYRLYHDSFRGFIEMKLGGASAMQRFHQTLVETLALWPAAADPFKKDYVLRHGVVQRVAAGRWQEVRALCLNTGYLEAKIGLVGWTATKGDLEQAARRCPDAGLSKELSEVVLPQRLIGTIKTLVMYKNFGFISFIDNGKDIFFHISALQGVLFDELRVGDIVSCDVEDSLRGPRATHVNRVFSFMGR